MRRRRFIQTLAATPAMLLWVDSELYTQSIASVFCGREGVVGNSDVHPYSPNQSSAELRKQIEQIALIAQGRVGVAITLLESGESVGLLEDQ